VTQTKVQGLQDLDLHVADLDLCVSVISYIDKVFTIDRKNLFVFAGNEHSRDANQLQRLLGNSIVL